MYLECPVFRRCCFCLPLRRGILILAYLDLVCGAIEIAIPLLGVIIPLHREYVTLPLPLNIFLFFTDKIATVVLLIGLHTKRENLIRVYYKYTIVTLLASVLLTIIDISMMTNPHIMVYAAMIFFFITVCNIYLMLLVRSMLRKLKVSAGNNFGNRLADILTPTETEHSRIVNCGTV